MNEKNVNWKLILKIMGIVIIALQWKELLSIPLRLEPLADIIIVIFHLDLWYALVLGPWCQNQLLDQILSWHKQCSSISFYIYCKKATYGSKRVL